MSTYLFSLDDTARNYAREVLNETEENRLESIEKIRTWLTENPDIGGKTDDLSILAFLRGCKFDLERTKKKMKNFYRMRCEIPQWFANRNPRLAEIKELARLGVFVPLRKFYQNKQVVIVRTAIHDPRKHRQDDVFKTGKMILDVLGHQNEKLQIYGIIAVFDMQGISLAHARQLPPNRIKKAVHAWQNYHCRPKQLEFINAPIYINVVLNIFKSFMNDKLQGRVRVHFSGTETLHEVIDKEVLPVEYGGNDGSIEEQIDIWCRKLEEFSDWFETDELYKSKISRI